MFDVEIDDGGLARRAPPSVGGGLKLPRRKHRRPPLFVSPAFVIEKAFVIERMALGNVWLRFEHDQHF